MGTVVQKGPEVGWMVRTRWPGLTPPNEGRLSFYLSILAHARHATFPLPRVTCFHSDLFPALLPLSLDLSVLFFIPPLLGSGRGVPACTQDVPWTAHWQSSSALLDSRQNFQAGCLGPSAPSTPRRLR